MHCTKIKSVKIKLRRGFGKGKKSSISIFTFYTCTHMVWNTITMYKKNQLLFQNAPLFCAP